jgi:hypothetical protein
VYSLVELKIKNKRYYLQLEVEIYVYNI